jgi:hypothetical protein
MPRFFVGILGSFLYASCMSDNTMPMPSPQEETPPKNAAPRRWIAVAVVATVVVAALVGFMLLRMMKKESVAVSERSMPKKILFQEGHIPEVEVLDAVGNKKIVQRMTDYLRACGYDVVEMKIDPDGVVERSYVLDRAGNLAAAKQLAAAAGIPESLVYQKLDKKVYLDLTLVVGTDYKTLAAFAPSKERDAH